MNEPGYLTISVDDGHPTDLKAAELLAKYDLSATFYVPARNPEREVMSPEEIREIGAKFETGSHTFNHRPLKHLDREEARAEIQDGKRWLEEVTGKKVVPFCYPRGKFDQTTVELVREADFAGARTCMFNVSSYPQNPFLWGVSTHAYSHSAVTQIRHALLEGNFRGVSSFLLLHKCARDWGEHFLHAVDFVERYGGVAHLYFHSWEIEEQNQWKKLELLLKGISERKALARVTNGELFARWHAKRHASTGGLEGLRL
jgi:peptidoglycan/xylan/chitin deacetylase (PgdA/CDA1 family)